MLNFKSLLRITCCHLTQIKMPTKSNNLQFIILFDGICNLCNKSVQFIIRNDKKNKFVFASLQSEIATQLLREIDIKNSLDTIILLKGKSHFVKSDAVLEIAKNLGGVWALFYAFKIFPKFLRDAAYTYIANRRYSWFGKRKSCMLPSRDLRYKFLG